MARYDIALARQAKINKQIEAAWEKYDNWAKSHAGDILYTSGGIPYGPRNFAEFKEHWNELTGKNKLNQIKQAAMYKTDYRTAIKIRQKLREIHPDIKLDSLKGMRKEDVVSIRTRYNYDTDVKAYADNALAELETIYRTEHALSPDMPIPKPVEVELKRKVGKEVSSYFYGS